MSEASRSREAAASSDAWAFLDAENLFWHEEFFRRGEFEPYRLGLIAQMATEADSPLGSPQYVEYAAVLAEEPTLEIVPKVVDHLVDWLEDSFALRDGRAYGFVGHKGVRAARERVASKTPWTFVETSNAPEAADEALLTDLRRVAEKHHGVTLVVGSSDAKSFLGHAAQGPLTAALAAVEGLRRRRPAQVPHRLVVVLGARRQSPEEARWRQRSDLGPADVVYRLSEVVAAAIQRRHAEAAFRPRSGLAPDEPDQQWRGDCGRWASMADPAAADEIARALGKPESWGFKNRWKRFENGLLWLTAQKRDQLVRLAVPLAARHAAWVGAQHAGARAAHGAATMPASSLHAASAVEVFAP